MMDVDRSDVVPDFRIVGFKCTLFNDPEKCMEINSGALLVPWGNSTNITMDRYDCRGYLHDLAEHDADNVIHRSGFQTAEELATEEMCDYERYLELQTDIHEEQIFHEEERKRQKEALKETYVAIGFSYDENEMEKNPDTDNNDQAKPIGSPDRNQASKEFEGEPYICPPELILPPDMILPEFDRQAAIIEKTAIFIARNNAQMEIVLKTKQSNNPQFKFLNYDDKLNPFYKQLVKLIKSGRYIPRHRPNTSDSSKTDSDFIGDDTNPDEPYELKLPKVDISNTAYASLINRFKKSNEDKIISNSSEMHNGSDNTNVLSDNQNVSSTSGSIFQELSKAEQPAVPVLTNEDYERFYQEYYRHYYSYYYMHYSSNAVSSGEAENESWVVSESARAAATAALAAVNAVRQSQLAFSSSSSPPADLRSIIDKMAEYVARNGDEFQNVVKSKKQDDPRFAFLQTGHIHHDYYIVKKKEFAAKFHKSEQESDAKSSPMLNTSESKNQEVKEETSPLSSSVKNKSISFRLAKSSSSNRLKEMEETTGSAVVNDEENSAVADATTIPQSTYYNTLPGICNYSSDTESEGEQEELVGTADVKRVSSRSSPVENVNRTEEVISKVQTANLTAAPQVSQPSHRNRVDSPSSSQPTSNGKTSKSLTIGTLLSAEEIARDIQSMEEEARQQLERRKRAALFAAKLQAAKLRKLEEKLAEEQKKKCETPSPPPPPITRLTSTAAPPPPPSSVPAAVANAVAAQLKTQREKALEAAATAAASKESERSKFARRASRSPPAAYAKHRRRSLSRSPSREKTYTRSRRRRSRSPSSSYDHSSRRSRHKRL
nr:splicing factor arginine:serine rich 8 [Hymenolepis microstoma]